MTFRNLSVVMKKIYMLQTFNKFIYNFVSFVPEQSINPITQIELFFHVTQRYNHWIPYLFIS